MSTSNQNAAGGKKPPQNTCNSVPVTSNSTTSTGGALQQPPPPAQSTSPPVSVANNNAPKYGTLVPNRVFVGGISANTTEGELAQLFSAYGTVKATKIISDRAGVSKGYGFVTFESEEEAKRLQREADNIMLRERRLNIAPAIKKQPFNRSFDVASPPPSVASSAQAAQFYYSAAAAAAAAASPYAYQNGMAYYATPPSAAAPNTAPGGAANENQSNGAYSAAPPPTAVYQAPPPPAAAAAPPPYHHMPPYAMPQPLFVPHQYNPYQPIPYDAGQYYSGVPTSSSGGGSPGRSAAPLYHPMYSEPQLYYNMPLYALDPTGAAQHHTGLYPAEAAALMAGAAPSDPNVQHHTATAIANVTIEGVYGNGFTSATSSSSNSTTPPQIVHQPSTPHNTTNILKHNNSTTPVVSLLSVGPAHERDARSMQSGRKFIQNHNNYHQDNHQVASNGDSHRGIQSFRWNHQVFTKYTGVYHRNTQKCDVNQCRNTWSKKRRNYTTPNTASGGPTESSSSASARTSSNSSANAAIFDENLNEKNSLFQPLPPPPSQPPQNNRRNRRNNQRNRHQQQQQQRHQEVGGGDAPSLTNEDKKQQQLCQKMDAIKL